MIEFDDLGATIRVNVEATRRMYSLIERGETENCSCGDCAFFAAHRDAAYPATFLDLLARLGIDYRKEDETWSVVQPGQELFVGSFDFVGTVRLGDVSSQNEPLVVPSFRYNFSDRPGYPWTEMRARDWGFDPIGSIGFERWFRLAADGTILETTPI